MHWDVSPSIGCVGVVSLSQFQEHVFDVFVSKACVRIDRMWVLGSGYRQD